MSPSLKGQEITPARAGQWKEGRGSLSGGDRSGVEFEAENSVLWRDRSMCRHDLAAVTLTTRPWKSDIYKLMTSETPTSVPL